MSDVPVRCGVIGFPLAHTRSPELHQRFAEQCGIAQSYSVLAVPDSDFEQAARAFFTQGGFGLNVTLPYKRRALEFADTVSGRAERAGAANLLARQPEGTVLADNVDGIGFLRDLERLKFDPGGARVCVLGAGGAAAGVIAALLKADVEAIAVLNRSVGRVNSLIVRMKDQRVAVLSEEHEAFDLLVNATSASLANECPHFPETVIKPGALAYDLVYAAQPTAFMRRATGCGAHAHDGWGMLVEQAAESFHIWHGIRPDTGSFHHP